MPNLIRVDDFNAPELDAYVRLTGNQLRNATEYEGGIFIAESPTVIEVAMEAGIEPISMLTDERLLGGDVERIIARMPGDMPVYVSSRDVLKRLTGFELTRGALAAMRRPAPIGIEELLAGARRIAVLEDIADSTNIGAIFRSAAALGIDAVLLTPSCCDPYCRRAVRVSMGTVFKLPLGVICNTPEQWYREGRDILRSLGFKSVAMALRDDTVALDDEALNSEERLAIILGTEGAGLRPCTIDSCDYTVKIPMMRGVDSLNVACAATVAFYALVK